MRDPFVVHASHPITALSCLAPPETLYAPEAAKSISWLHDGHPLNSNGSEYLISFITLWHACSPLQPDLDCFFDFFFDSEFRRVAKLRVPVFTTTTPTLLGERLTAAWLSHPMHVPVLTSPGDRLQVWLCDSILFLSGATLTSRVTVTHPYVVQDTGGSGESSERILACQLLDSDTCMLRDYYGPSDVRGCWRVGYDIDDGSMVRMSPADWAPMTDSALLEDSWPTHALGPASMASPDLDSPDSSSSSQSRGHARARGSDSSTSTALEGSHEARGVGLIIKALVQQNAGASLFLRTMVYVVALLCFVHSVLVLGE